MDGSTVALPGTSPLPATPHPFPTLKTVEKHQGPDKKSWWPWEGRLSVLSLSTLRVRDAAGESRANKWLKQPGAFFL